MHTSRFPAALLIVCGFVFAVLATPVPTLKPSKQELDKWYSLLSIHGNDSATHGLLPLAAQRPEDVVPYLAEKLKPLALTERQARDIVANLASEDRRMVKAAFELTTYLDVRLALTPQEAFENSSQEVRRRLVAAWDGLPFESPSGETRKEPYSDFNCKIVTWDPRQQDGKLVEERALMIERNGETLSRRIPGTVSEIDSPQWKQATRAILLLEHFATPGAIELLKVMASGHQDAKPTQAAKAALERRAEKNPPKSNPEAAWNDLLDPDEVVAGRAVLQLYRSAGAAVPFLKVKCVPMKLSEERCRELLNQLGSEDEKTWRAARNEFEYFDPRLALDLPKLYELVPDGPARIHLTAVLMGRRSTADIKPPIRVTFENDGSCGLRTNRISFRLEHKLEHLSTREGRRLCTAARLLRQIDTPDAVEILEQIATGHEKVPPTVWAREILAARKEK